MSSKDYYRKQIESKRKDLVSVRTKITKAKEDKKRKMASLAVSLKNTKDASRKESIRKQKVSVVAQCDREVEGFQKKIESLKKDIEKLRASMARAK